MFRRRPGFRRLRRAIAPGLAPQLRHGHNLLAAGSFAEAARIFEALAGASMGAGPRSGHLLLQAGHARVLNGEQLAGVEQILRGLQLIAASGRAMLFDRAARRSIEFLQQQGLVEAASQVEQLLGGQSGSPTTAGSPPKRAQAARLPTHCPSCGAALRPDEVEWLDDVTAECDFCGSPVRAGQA